MRSNMATVPLFDQSNMATVTSCGKLFNINETQYGHRFFVWLSQDGDRDVMQKTIQY